MKKAKTYELKLVFIGTSVKEYETVTRTIKGMHKVAEMIYPIKDIAFEELTCEGIPITIFIKDVNTGFMIPYNPTSVVPEATLEWYERMFELNGMEV